MYTQSTFFSFESELLHSTKITLWLQKNHLPRILKLNRCIIRECGFLNSLSYWFIDHSQQLNYIPVAYKATEIWKSHIFKNGLCQYILQNLLQISKWNIARARVITVTQDISRNEENLCVRLGWPKVQRWFLEFVHGMNLNMPGTFSRCELCKDTTIQYRLTFCHFNRLLIVRAPLSSCD